MNATKIQNILITQQKTTRDVAEFFLSKAIKPDYFKDIVTELSKVYPNQANLIPLGMFEAEYYQRYKSIKGAKSYMPTIITHAIDILKESQLLKDLQPVINQNFVEVNTNYAKAIYDLGLLDNILFGTKFIINRYRQSVFKIENTDKYDSIDLGTGFLIQEFNNNFIATNQHVLANAKKLRLLDVDDNEYKFSIFYENEQEDIAFLKIEDDLNGISPFTFSLEQDLLSDIITIGYPSIPTSREAYQVIHRGEINSHIENYYGNKLFLISAKTSSGNSGSPVINEMGQVVGMIAQELFEKGALIEKGKLPYIGVIPTEVITELLRTHIIVTAKKIDN